MVTKTAKAKILEPNVPEATVTDEEILEPIPVKETAPSAPAGKTAGKNGSKEAEWLMTVPTPVMMVDKEMNVTFVNQAGAGAVSKTL